MWPVLLYCTFKAALNQPWVEFQHVKGVVHSDEAEENDHRLNGAFSLASFSTVFWFSCLQLQCFRLPLLLCVHHFQPRSFDNFTVCNLPSNKWQKHKVSLFHQLESLTYTQNLEETKIMLKRYSVLDLHLSGVQYRQMFAYSCPITFIR